MKLENGRPQSTDNRLDREVKVYNFLDSIDISYARVDHDSADNMDACNKIEDTLGAKICKNLFLCNRQKTEFYLLMMPGDKPFKTKDITSQLGCARLSFASEEYMLEYLDIQPGAVSVMGLMNDKDNHVQLVIDKPVIEDDTVGCHPCVCTSSLRIATDDILNKFLPAVNHKPIIVDLPLHVEE